MNRGRSSLINGVVKPVLAIAPVVLLVVPDRYYAETVGYRPATSLLKCR